MANSSFQPPAQAVSQTQPLPRLSTDYKYAQTFYVTADILKKSHCLGKGSFGEVYACEFGDEVIALKSYKTKYNLLREFRVLASLNSPYILAPLGICYTFPSIALEYLPNNSLEQFLVNGNSNKLSLSKKISMLIEICLGLIYMHSQGYYHFDIKDSNILLDQDFHIKISDLGLAVHKTSPTDVRKRGTAGWRAPELLDSKYSPTVDNYAKHDIYSFGILMLVLFDVYNPRQLAETVRDEVTIKGLLFAKMESILQTHGLNHSLKNLILKCISTDLNSRPTLAEIQNILASVLNAMPHSNSSLLLPATSLRSNLCQPIMENYFWINSRCDYRMSFFNTKLFKKCKFNFKLKALFLEHGNYSLLEIMAFFSIATEENQKQALRNILNNNNLHFEIIFTTLSIYIAFSKSVTANIFLKKRDELQMRSVNSSKGSLNPTVAQPQTTQFIDAKYSDTLTCKSILENACKNYIDNSYIDAIKSFRFFKAMYIKELTSIPLNQSKVVEEYLHGPNFNF